MPPKSHSQVQYKDHQYQMMESDKFNGDKTLRIQSMTTSSSSSRWPRKEIEALINLRTRVDTKYQEISGPKGPMWEEISVGMKGIGYDRNAKRCKEKWENINKYFKKLKENNIQRPQDSKTCTYFHQLDALYKDKNMITATTTTSGVKFNSEPLMVRPEQQWPPPLSPQKQHQEVNQSSMHIIGNVLLQENQQHYDHDEDDDDEDDIDDDDDDDNGCDYEIVENKKKQQQPPPTHEAPVATCE